MSNSITSILILLFAVLSLQCGGTSTDNTTPVATPVTVRLTLNFPDGTSVTSSADSTGKVSGLPAGITEISLDAFSEVKEGRVGHDGQSLSLETLLGSLSLAPDKWTFHLWVKGATEYGGQVVAELAAGQKELVLAVKLRESTPATLADFSVSDSPTLKTDGAVVPKYTTTPGSTIFIKFTSTDHNAMWKRPEAVSAPSGAWANSHYGKVGPIEQDGNKFEFSFTAPANATVGEVYKVVLFLYVPYRFSDGETFDQIKTYWVTITITAPASPKTCTCDNASIFVTNGNSAECPFGNSSFTCESWLTAAGGTAATKYTSGAEATTKDKCKLSITCS